MKCMDRDNLRSIRMAQTSMELAQDYGRVAMMYIDLRYYPDAAYNNAKAAAHHAISYSNIMEDINDNSEHK
jgi:hypothetical protein